MKNEKRKFEKCVTGRRKQTDVVGISGRVGGGTFL